MPTIINGLKVTNIYTLYLITPKGENETTEDRIKRIQEGDYDFSISRENLLMQSALLEIHNFIKDQPTYIGVGSGSDPTKSTTLTNLISPLGNREKITQRLYDVNQATVFAEFPQSLTGNILEIGSFKTQTGADLLSRAELPYAIQKTSEHTLIVNLVIQVQNT